MVLFVCVAVSSIDRYASIGSLSNRSGSMATQVGSAADDRRLASVMSVEHQMAVKRGSSVASGMLAQCLLTSCCLSRSVEAADAVVIRSVRKIIFLQREINQVPRELKCWKLFASQALGVIMSRKTPESNMELIGRRITEISSYTDNLTQPIRTSLLYASHCKAGGGSI